MKTILILQIFLSLFLTPTVTIANGNIDNFWEKVNILKSNKQKIEDLEKHAQDYLDQHDFDNALACANRGLDLAVKINSQENISDFYIILGRINCFKNQWNKGLEYFNKSLTVSKQLNNKEYIARAYNNIAFLKNNQNNPDEAQQNCEKALKIYREIGNKKGIAYSYNTFGHIYTQLSEIKIASEYLLKSIKIIDELGGDVLQYDNYAYLAQSYINLGKIDSTVYFLNKVLESGNQHVGITTEAFANCMLSYVYNFYGNYSKAIEYQLKGLAIYEKINYKKGIVMGYSFMGDIFKSKGDYKNAIKYNNKCLELAKEIGQNYGIVVSYNSLGSNYYKLKDYEAAKQYFFNVLHLAEKYSYQIELSHANDALGLIYLDQKNYGKALPFFLKSLEINKKISFQFGIAGDYRHIGTYYQNLTEYGKAIQYLKMALKLDEELEDLVLTASDFLALSENYFCLSQYKPAYENFKKYKTIEDSLKSETHTNRITQLEMQYEFDKKQKEQQQKELVYQAKIKNQRIFTFSTIVFIVLLSILSFLTFHNYRLKQKSIQKEIELKQVESEKKHEVDQMKLHLFANISHDIRTPLTLIKGPLHQLVDSNEVPAHLQKNIELMYKNTNLLQRLVDQVLDFQKLDSNLMGLTLNQLDIIAFTKKTTGSFAYYIENKKCRLDFFSEYKELIIWFDQEKIEKVIHNLLFNAIKFTPDKGSIRIEISADKNKVYIIVKDSGFGIPSDHLDLIFERYHQVEKTKAYYKGGSGIGLAHSKELVQLHRGEITVKSTEQEGSEFTVTLPRNKDFYKEEGIIYQTMDNIANEKPFQPIIPEKLTPLKNDITKAPETNNPDEVKDKPTVLVIEDDYDMHQYIVNCLQPHYNIYRAYNGTEGFHLAIKHNPEVIISDIMMEKMDGIELCCKIKTELQVCHIPVILLTALASLENKIVGFETGADDYITKPFDTKLLLVRIQNIIQSRRMLRELFSKNMIIEPGKITNNSIDEEFLKKAINIVEDNIADSDLDVDMLCSKMHVSRSVFYRKIKALTNLSSNDFIKNIRLKRASQLLKENNRPVSQIAYEVGFADHKYFSTCFRNYFGQSPSEYVRKEFTS